MNTNIRRSAASHTPYLRGKPASEWIDALSTRRRAREQVSDRSLPPSEGLS